MKDEDRRVCDIVDRLRIIWVCMDDDRCNAERAEAADEIERLRADLDQARRQTSPHYLFALECAAFELTIVKEKALVEGRHGIAANVADRIRELDELAKIIWKEAP